MKFNEAITTVSFKIYIFLGPQAKPQTPTARGQPSKPQQSSESGATASDHREELKRRCVGLLLLLTLHFMLQCMT